MVELATSPRRLTFNGPLEAGIRAVTILGAAFPRSYDLHRLTALDYLLVRTGQIGGPNDLHPPVPIRTPATEVRRKIIQSAILLMMTRDLISRKLQNSGIKYLAGESAQFFLGSLTSPYMIEMKSRAAWLIHHVADYSDNEFDALMKRLFDAWVQEFQFVEEPGAL